MSELVVHDTRPLIQYAADGTQTVFSFPFAILAATDLMVVLEDGTTPSGLTVSGVGSSDGGSVTFASAPPAGTRVTLYRDMPLERSTDFQEAGVFRAAAINAELDRLALGLQQVETLAASALRRGLEDRDETLILPGAAERAGRVLSFDDAGRASTIAAPGSSVQAAAASADAAAAAASTASAHADAASAAAQTADSAAAAIAAQRPRQDLQALHASQVAASPSVAAMPLWGFDARLDAGVDALPLSRSGSALATDVAGALVSAPADTPRIDHDRVTRACRGVPIEATRHNLLHDSLAPATQTRSLTAQTYTLSVHGPGSCTLSGGPTATASEGAPVTFTLSQTTSVTFTVAGTLSAMQCESGDHATTPVATPASGGASRPEETLVLATPTWLDPAQGSVVIDAYRGDDPAERLFTLLAVDAGSEDDGYELRYRAVANQLQFLVHRAGALDAYVNGDLGTGGWGDDASRRVAVRYGDGEIALFIDGVKAATATVTSVAGLSHLRIGCNAGGQQWNASVRSVAYFPGRLADADLIALTGLGGA